MKNLLKELRKSKEISQNELSIILDISQSAIAKWELGKAEPTANALIKLSKYYEVTTDYLLGIEDDFGNIITEPTQQNYLTTINNSLTKISRAKLESYAEGLLASENADKLYKLQKEKKGE